MKASTGKSKPGMATGCDLYPIQILSIYEEESSNVFFKFVTISSHLLWQLLQVRYKPHQASVLKAKLFLVNPHPNTHIHVTGYSIIIAYYY